MEAHITIYNLHSHFGCLNLGLGGYVPQAISDNCFMALVQVQVQGGLSRFHCCHGDMVEEEEVQPDREDYG